MVRFQTTPANASDPTSGYIHVSRVRYNVVRPCGTNEGIKMFQTLAVINGPTNVAVKWFGTATLQAAPSLPGTWADVMSITNVSTNSYSPKPGAMEFYRLQFPPPRSLRRNK